MLNDSHCRQALVIGVPAKGEVRALKNKSCGGGCAKGTVVCHLTQESGA